VVFFFFFFFFFFQFCQVGVKWTGDQLNKRNEPNLAIKLNSCEDLS
jgi:hypothetical protein